MVRLEERLRTSFRMMKLNLGKKGREPLTILCLGAHSDDIEIGCGGTLLQLSQGDTKPKFHWVVFSATGKRDEEARKAVELFTPGCEKEVVVKDFRDGFLPFSGPGVKEFFEELKDQVNPDLIFTHWQGDAHQDHRMISELTWNTFRNNFILEYEIPKYDGDLGRANVFMPLESPSYRLKVDHLFTVFQSQRTKPWFAGETFLGLMRVRGMESNSASGYAEAFYARKVVLGGLS